MSQVVELRRKRIRLNCFKLLDLTKFRGVFPFDKWFNIPLVVRLECFLWSLSPISRSLSLSHTRTHAHTRTLSLSLCLWFGSPTSIPLMDLLMSSEVVNYPTPFVDLATHAYTHSQSLSSLSLTFAHTHAHALLHTHSEDPFSFDDGLELRSA